MAIALKPTTRRNAIHQFIESIVGDCMHAKRILSLSNAVEGIMYASSLSLSAIGKALAVAQGLNAKHAVKQIDRFFSNKKIHLDIFLSSWVSFVIGSRQEIVVALDWTEFDSDDHSTVALNMITQHGRATPLLWKTYIKSEMNGKRNYCEDVMLLLLQSCLPNGCRVTVLADRGFGDTDFLLYLKKLGFDYVIRIKSNITMTVGAVTKKTCEWLSPSGNARLYKNVLLTQTECYVPAVVTVQAKKMSAPWILATSLSTSMSSKVINLYGKRFTIEECFRDVKDIKFGMGLSHVSIRRPERRDRILMASAIATSLLTLLGAAGEALGFDRLLKVNTVKTRTHSLLTQGAFYFQAMINYKDEKLILLINKFTELLSQQKVFQDLFCWI
jgi:hypothetical protein